MKYAAVRKYCLSLPEAFEQPHHHFGSFRVRGKIFVTVLPGQECIHVFLPEQRREPALALYGEFTEKLLWGGKVVGLRVTLGAAESTVVQVLVRQAWEYKAPQSLLLARGQSGE